MNITIEATLKRRMEALHEGLARRNLKGLLIHQTPYIYHLTYWLPPAWTETFLVISQNQSILVSSVTPADVHQAWNKMIAYNNFSLDSLVQPQEEALAALMEAISDLNLAGQPVGVALGSIGGHYALELAEHVQLKDATSFLYERTALKDELAIHKIRQREAMLDRAFRTAQQVIRPEMTELELYGVLYNELTNALGSPFALDCDIGSGPRTLLDEPQPTMRRLQPGETILIDLFPNLGGYVADYTRNFVLGQPSEGQRNQHAALEKALKNAESILRPGVTAAEIDRIARSTLEAEGFAKTMYQHHSGHAFGLTTPEPPVIIPANPSPLQAGMVIAIEPGIYHPEVGGMRLEGNYLITENGFERLDGFPAELVACP
jgi:Xaa-Pro aminopeptidase